ncbi:MAG TPA: hypothetical protein VLA74_05245 [Nitrososphaeraceae archaeon]|nr:hypothetical protein [Nitrososphaeraceae archaeon]
MKKEYYSGKRKRHTLKIKYIIVNKEGKILHKSKYQKGKNYSYYVYKDEPPITLPLIKNYFDIGYEVIENYFPNLTEILPLKKDNIEHTEKEEKQQKTS